MFNIFESHVYVMVMVTFILYTDLSGTLNIYCCAYFKEAVLTSTHTVCF